MGKFVNYCLLHNISAKIGFFQEGNCKFSGMYRDCITFVRLVINQSMIKIKRVKSRAVRQFQSVMTVLIKLQLAK